MPIHPATSSTLRLLALTFGLLILGIVNGSNTDSLEAAYGDMPDGVAKVDLAIDLAIQYSITHSEKIVPLLEETIELAHAIGYQKGEATALYELGKHKLVTLSPYDEVTTLLLRSLRLHELLGDSLGAARDLLQLGVVNYSLGNYANAASFLNQSLEESSDQQWTLHTANYLLGLCYSELGRYDEAHALLQQALTDYAKDDPEKELLVRGFIGKLLHNQGRHEESLEMLKQTIAQSGAIEDRSVVAPLHAFASSAFLELGDLDMTIYHGKMAVEMIDVTSGSIYVMEALHNLQSAYASKGDMGKAYRALYRWNQISDSMGNSQAMERIASQKAQYDFEKELMKEKAQLDLEKALTQQELVRQRLIRNASLIGVILLFVLALVFLRQRLRIAKEKAQSDRLLLNILPEEVAQDLKKFGQSEAKDFEAVSVLFTDFKEFTQQSAQMTAAELVAVVNHCFNAFDQICEKYKVEKIKTIGDSYMAAAGLGTGQKNAVIHVTLAALEMNAFILDGQTGEGEPIPFEMRLGLHTGPVVAGIVGVKKFQYDLWGDTVNTASRMESHGEVGKVNISHTTYELIKDDPRFTFESRGKLEVKGKGEIDMYFVELA